MPGKIDFNSLKAGCVASSSILSAAGVLIGRTVEVDALVDCTVAVGIDLISAVGVIIGVAVVQALRIAKIVIRIEIFLDMDSTY